MGVDDGRFETDLVEFSSRGVDDGGDESLRKFFSRMENCWDTVSMAMDLRLGRSVSSLGSLVVVVPRAGDASSLRDVCERLSSSASSRLDLSSSSDAVAACFGRALPIEGKTLGWKMGRF